MENIALRKLHNLALNCESEAELREYCIRLDLYGIDTKLAGECSVLPIYYFTASKTSGKMQDRDGNWYTPKKEEV